MGIRHNDQLWLLDILSDSVDSCRENTRILAVLKWLWVFSRKPRSLKQTDMFFCFFLCEAISCIGDFSIFLYALSCFDLFAYAACQCMWFLHEANVAIDFSFSLLSLCDIVYWETNKQKKHSNVNKKKLFQKRILWYSLLSPFVMILVKSLFFFPPFLLFFFPKTLFALFSHADSRKALPFILDFLFFFYDAWQKGMFMWHVAESPVSIVTSGVLLRFSQRDCHSYNSGNPIGPEHRCIPPPLASHRSALILRLLVCVCALYVRKSPVRILIFYK